MNIIRKINKNLLKIIITLLLFLNLYSVSLASSDDFIISVKTDNSGSTSDTQFRIPTKGSGYNYNVDCDNDGVNETTGETGDYTCNYSSAGTYQIRISGNFPTIFFNDNDDKLKIVGINQWGNQTWSSMENAFKGCKNLNSVGGNATDIPNLSNVENISQMFANSTFNQPIDNWDVSNITNMSYMFFDSTFNQPIDNWDVSNVTDMFSMFYYSKFNQPINNWDVSSVTNMSGLFGNSQFNQPINNWDVSNVTKMYDMFSHSKFNQPINNWDVSNVTHMKKMFFASKFNQLLDNWNITNVIYMDDMLSSSKLSIENYDKILIAWNNLNVKDNIKLGAMYIKYCDSEVQRNNLINNNNWTITDSGKSCPNYAPTNINLSKNDIDENNNSNESIGLLTTEDQNTSDTHTYSLSCSTPGVDDSKFNISGNRLRASNIFDYESPDDNNSDNIYNICIRSADNDGLFIDKNFSVNVNNLNDAININTDSCLDHSLQGFAWSDTIGWISMDCKSANSDINYGVDIDKNGNLTGEAWSDTIGWISFDYYGEENSRPKFNKITKKLEGYVKALGGLENNTDGWNGKISLAGISDNGYNYSPIYNTVTNEFDEYAWGDKIVGWIDFKTNYGVVTMDPFYFTFTSNKGTGDNPVAYDGSIVLSWETMGANSCIASNGNDTTWLDNINKSLGNPNKSTETISNLKHDTVFTLTCEDSQGNSIVKDVNIRVAPAAPVLFLSVDDDNIPSNTSTTIKWNVENVENCVASSSSSTWDKNINSSDGIHSDSTGNLTEATNWFKVKCDSVDSDYYPNGVEELVWVNVEKLTLAFYPFSRTVKFNDSIRIYWKPEFAVKCIASGDLTDFNGDKDYDDSLHIYDSSDKEDEGNFYNIDMMCEGTAGQKIYKNIQINVGKNPRYQEI